MEKATFHGRLPDPKDFAAMFVDLNQLLKPRLQVMDGIIGMEGDGPYSGTPRRVGAVLASSSFSALDVVAARLIHMAPERIPTVQVAQGRGLLPEDLDRIEVMGGKVENLQVTDFRMPSTYRKGRGGLKRIERRLLSLTRVYALRPVIVKEACTNCGRCVRACPKGAIKSRSGKARVNHRYCICCYTCHEMCTSHAIRLERSLTGRTVAKLVERGGKGK
jgi:Pyruvate/2-oxoacid:ferredoxin oxidoreductase delta subunit